MKSDDCFQEKVQHGFLNDPCLQKPPQKGQGPIGKGSVVDSLFSKLQDYQAILEVSTKIHVSQLKLDSNCLSYQIKITNLNPLEKHHILQYINQQNKQLTPINIKYKTIKKFQQPIPFSSMQSQQPNQQITISEEFDATAMELTFKILFDSGFESEDEKDQLREMEEYFKQTFEKMKQQLLKVMASTRKLRYLKNI